MDLLVDTSVWSLAFRRDTPPDVPEVAALRRALELGHGVVTTGLVVQELLQRLLPERTRAEVAARLAHLRVLEPTIDDHVAAASLRNVCRAGGVQIGTIDAILVQLCLTHGARLLSTDRDFAHAARVVDVPLWEPPSG